MGKTTELAARIDNGGVVAQAKSEIREAAERVSDMIQPKLRDALPKHITAQEFMGATLTALRLNPDLLVGPKKCTPQSIMASLLECALLGLFPGPRFQLYHLTPRWSSKLRSNECVGVIDYRGYVHLARASGVASYVVGHEVCENDTFDWDLGTDERLVFKPALVKRGEPIAYFAKARQSDGQVFHEIMNYEEAVAHRDRFAPRNREQKIVGPWAEHFDRMAIKTVVKRVCNTLPRVPQLALAFALDEGGERPLQPLSAGAWDPSVIKSVAVDAVAEIEVEPAEEAPQSKRSSRQQSLIPDVPLPEEPPVDPDDAAWMAGEGQDE